ncbi:MAG TPA: phosphoribosyltransferase family protein, partial [Patescibacteria group bacterium]|nr:phosphoribosyltransferase family protein [Patescibacteria group bacterium]
LGSNIANYAILTADDRMTKPGNTSTKIPGHEFFKDPIHVIFGDDVRITGTTANRVERICLENGALSFRAMYNLFVDPAIARTNPQIENALNMYRVKGELDHDIAYIMNQQGFVPVQRLIRLVLARQNRKELKRFAFEYVSESSIRTLYEYAMSNDYMQDPQYAESLTMLGSIIEQKGMKNSGRIRRLARETEARLETSRVNV